ncbi:D-alanyl-D-alanine carboxypeptidase [Streptomyces sp. JJ36]|nr:D-alanyl-D-alanine carboxypeptidase [Streptomyces sp. JJ36]
MSTIGGAKLGRPGTQVDPLPGEGAPKLPKKLSARSWIVADAESGNVLAAHNAHWELAPASTLKMLLADVLLPKYPATMEYTVKREDLEGMGSGSSKVGVKEGLPYTVEDLWNGVFLRSGNDAVHVLCAINGGKKQTVAEMNAHARELRALDTHVVSPDGYDAPGQVSSAYDLTLIARSGMQKEDFRRYASTVRTRFPGEWKDDKGDEGDKRGEEDGGGTTPTTRQTPEGDPEATADAKPDDEQRKRKHFQIQNTNRLLTGDYGLDPYPGIAGVKNGYTSNAGHTFTGVAERDGRVLLVTVMNPQEGGSQEVYKETAALFDWGFEAADAVRPVGELVPPGTGEEQAGADTDEAGAKNPGGTQDPDGATVVSAGAEGPGGSGGGGMGIALGVAGGSVVVLTGLAFLVHRRWPAALPDLSRLRSGPPASGGGPGSGPEKPQK